MGKGVRIVKNTSYLYIKMAVTVFVSLWTTRLILSSLGVEDYGIYNIVGGALTMLGFLNSTLSNATQRFMSYSQGEGRVETGFAIFNISVVLHLIVALISVLIYLVGGYFFFQGLLNIPPDRLFAAKIVYLSLVVSTALNVMTVPYDAVLNAHENMLYVAIVGVIESFLKLMVAFACVKSSGDRLILYGILMSCISLITMMIMRIYCRRHYQECHFSPKRYWSRSLLGEMLGYSGWNFMGATSSLIGFYGRNVVVNHFFGVLANAAQGVMSQLQGQLLVFTNNMMRAIRPVIVKAEGSGNREEMLRWTLTGCRFSFLLLVWLAVPVIVEAPYILSIWLKNVPQWTVVFLRLSLATILFESAFYGLGTALEATGNIKGKNIQNTFINLAPIIIAWFLFKADFGPEWIYISVLGCTVVKQLLLLLLCRKWCGLSFRRYVSYIALPLSGLLLAMLAVGILISNVLEGDFLRLVLNCVAMWAIYASITWFAVFSRDDRCFVKDLANSILGNIVKKSR